MCRTLNSLIPLVLLLSLGGHALAEDLNPPDFAGGDQTAVVFWGFNDDSDQPTSTTYDPAYIYNPELADPVFGFRYYNGAWQWQAGQGINGDGAMLLQDEESLVQKEMVKTSRNMFRLRGKVLDPLALGWKSGAAAKTGREESNFQMSILREKKVSIPLRNMT